MNIATNKAVINSAYSLKKFNNAYESYIINFFGEFCKYKDEIYEKKIFLKNLFNPKIINFLPKLGKIKSRISFLIIFLMSFFPLNRLLKKERPDFLVIHLITSLPLILLCIFNYQTKFILRVSGLPKLGFMRKFLWKLAAKKLFCITCPTKTTYEFIKKSNIIDNKKIKLLYDPILEISKIKRKNKKNSGKLPDENFYIAVGRLTYQKNFLFLCKSFNQIIKNYPKEKLFIAGEGEDENILRKYINENNLNKNIFLIGFKDNILEYFRNCKGFILSSKWEDPGFVLIEAAISRTFIFSSNCMNGPRELIVDNINGIVFENNNEEDFIKKFDLFYQLDRKVNKNLLLNNLKMAKNFTIFNHHKVLCEILK